MHSSALIIAIATLLSFKAIQARPRTSNGNPIAELWGVIANFDVSNCGDDIKWGLKPTALQIVDYKHVKFTAISPLANYTVFVPDGFDGIFYLDDGKEKASEVSSIHLSTVISNTTLEAFYKTRKDDKPYLPGKDKHLPVVAPLKDIRFADTDPSAAPINEQSTAADVRQSTKIHNSINITFCP